MTGHAFTFAGQALVARASGALWWPGPRWLIVADLHLGKSERMARRGGALLPPYETIETLNRLAVEIAALNPACVVSLGDGFDDDAAGHALPDSIRDRIDALAAGRDWLWIGGNHDPGSVCASLPGKSLPHWQGGQVTLRHQAEPPGPDISGHFHPCIRLAGQRRRAFLIGHNHLILPAFGAYTGGLPDTDPVLSALVPQGIAIACGARAIALPLGVTLRQRRRT